MKILPIIISIGLLIIVNITHRNRTFGSNSENQLASRITIHRTFLGNINNNTYIYGLMPRFTEMFEDYNEACHISSQNCLIIAQQNLSAALIRLANIQYVGQTLDIGKAPYFYDILNTVSNLQPYRAFNYELGQLLLPVGLKNENIDNENTYDIENIYSLGEKGLFFLCNETKKNTIVSLATEKRVAELRKLNTSALKNPCTSYQLPYYQGFNLFFYGKKTKAAINAYNLASFHTQAPKIAQEMEAIIARNSGDLLTSIENYYYQYRVISAELATENNTENISILAEQAKQALFNSIRNYQIKVLNEITGDTGINTYSGLKSILSNKITKKINNCINGMYVSDTDTIECEILNAGIKYDYINGNGFECPPRKNTDDLQFEYLNNTRTCI